MKLNQATDYAFRMVLHMSLLSPGERVTGAVLAERELIPERFLLKIMRSLIAAGIMRSFRGVDGGFALNREPKNISLLDVIRAVEGDAYLQQCYMIWVHVQSLVRDVVLLMKRWESFNIN